MTYHNAQKFINSAPTYNEENYSFDRISYLSSLLGAPHKNLNYIRLAGSNGKTICSSLLSSVLVEDGYNVCTINMSQLSEVTDNIRLNTAPLSIDDFTRTVQSVVSACSDMRKNIEEARLSGILEGDSSSQSEIPASLISGDLEITPTRAEILLLAALCVYKEKGCDLCIIESIHNDVDPSLFLKLPITAVICGAIPNSDKEQINRIKAYIRRGIGEVVSAPQNSLAYKTIADSCADINCRLTIPARSSLTLKQLSLIGTSFLYNGESYRLGLCGRFQTTNAITVIETLKVLRRHGYKISLEAEKNGLAKVKIKSKFEVLSVNPTIIADSTYKQEAVETVCESLFDFSEITGRQLQLMLPPDISLIKKYLAMLGDRGYNISCIYTLCDSDAEISDILSALPNDITLKSFKTAKAAVKYVFPTLNSDSFWLISGRYSFTASIRLEIMRTLEF